MFDYVAVTTLTVTKGFDTFTETEAAPLFQPEDVSLWEETLREQLGVLVTEGIVDSIKIESRVETLREYLTREDPYNESGLWDYLD